MCICISSVSHLRSYQTYVLNHVRLYHLGQQLGVAWCVNVGGTAFGWTWLLNACWNLKFHKQEKQAWRRQTTAAASGEAWHFTLCGKKKKVKKKVKICLAPFMVTFLWLAAPHRQVCTAGVQSFVLAASTVCILRMFPFIDLVQKLEKTHIPLPQWVRVVCVWWFISIFWFCCPQTWVIPPRSSRHHLEWLCAPQIKNHCPKQTRDSQIHGRTAGNKIHYFLRTLR